MEDLKRKLLLLRHKKKLNAEGLAKFLGVSKDSIKNWSSGRFKPGDMNMIILEEAFKKEKIK